MGSEADNVASWLVAHAAQQGARPALRDPERTLSYAALEQRCMRAAGVLAAHGVGRGARVALLLGNRTATLEAVFAAARLGAIAVPLNTRLAVPEVAELLDDCRPALLLFEESLRGLAEAACARLARAAPDRLAVGGVPDAFEAALAGATPERRVAPVSPEDPMILMYTSGTTGVPKGALLPHRKTLYNCKNAGAFFGLTREDRVLTVVPLFHSFGLAILSLPTLWAGGEVVLQPRFDAAAVWRAVEAHRISFLGGVPTLFRALLDALEREAPELSSLRFLFTAGAAIPVDLIHAFAAHGLALKQGFGQTETSILCCLDAADAVRKAGSVGKPVPHCELRIVHCESLARPVRDWEDCAVGESGEIVVRGPIIMTGYWERPEATAETIREGWLRTGDLGHFDAEGFVTLDGRSKELFISGGENVYPRQVEAVYEQHPAVREVAVVGIPDARWGEVGCAYLVLQAGAALDPTELTRFGRERLAAFKVPQRFVAVPELPRTASGKVQKHKLRHEGDVPFSSRNARAEPPSEK
jgi:acyl-CoA synthetase (AMP-forming)/AMP-acid ligase II